MWERTHTRPPFPPCCTGVRSLESRWRVTPTRPGAGYSPWRGSSSADQVSVSYQSFGSSMVRPVGRCARFPCSMRCVEDLRARWSTAFAPVPRGPPLQVEVSRSDLVNCRSLRKREPAEPRRTAAWHGVPAGTWRAALDQANDFNGVAAWPVSLDCITP